MSSISSPLRFWPLEFNLSAALLAFRAIAEALSILSPILPVFGLENTPLETLHVVWSLTWFGVVIFEEDELGL